MDSSDARNEDDDYQVLVVGAGAAGLTLGCDLARRGVRALVIERSAALFPGSRGRGVQPRTQEVFDDLGVIDAILAAGGPLPRVLSRRPDATLKLWDLVEPAPAAAGVPYPVGWMLPQWRTQEILHARLRQLGGELRFGVALTSLSQDQQSVRALLTRADGSTTTVRADYLVGADGGRSTVRAALGVTMTGETLDPRASLVGDVRLTGLDRGNWHMWTRAPGDTLSLCPLPGTDHFALSVPVGEGPVDTSPQAVRAVIAERTQLPAEAVLEVLWTSEYRPRAALADRFQAGRVLLAGDAAHIHSPAGGQGLNTGVQDAYNLGWKLGRVLRHGAPPRLLDSYEAERLPVAADVLQLSSRLHHSYRGSGPAVARRAGQTSQLGIAYRDSPLSVETRADLPEEALRAGDRIPDLALPQGRLFDLLRGPHATLLAVGRPAPAGRAAELVVREFAELAPLGPGLFVVRPDGYLGLATQDPAALAAYLDLLGRG
ncbi:FAD-dependent monooxygenase [Kitasatospora sp. NBC_01266]|uniref:FAD-dependent monooxygenase n=1 Tax=Kitasatospora sp. NBC_01266 TaxID=2903572 RepID=UPI002E2F9C53|nr:FAD-dependent monooxygenase [Kitasatospora sp. NBC_01266]